MYLGPRRWQQTKNCLLPLVHFVGLQPCVLQWLVTKALKLHGRFNRRRCSLFLRFRRLAI